MFYRLGSFVVRARWWVLLLWAVIFGASLIFVPQVSGVLKAGGYTNPDSESARAFDVLNRELGTSPSSLQVVFSSPSLPATDPRFLQQMDTALAGLKGMREVSGIETYASSGDPSLISPDGTTTYALVNLNVDADTAMNLVPKLREAIKPVELETHVAGPFATAYDIQKVSENDLQRAEIYTFPLALVALLLIFGALVAAGAPVAMGGVAVFTTLALIYFLAQVTTMSIFVLNMASMLGLGVGIDYSLFIVSRFREELNRRGVAEAVAVATATAGRAVFFSGATVFFGLMGLLTFNSTMLRSLGIGGGLVVLVSVMAALTFLPALLSLLGRRVNSLSLIRIPAQGGTLWHRLALGVMKHPVLVLVPLFLFLSALGIPFLSVQLGSVDASALPPWVDSRRGFNLLEEKFGAGEQSPILVVVQSDKGVLRPENVAALYELAQGIAKEKDVARVTSLVTLDPRLTKEQYMALYSQPSQWSPEITKAVKSLGGDKATMLRVVIHTKPMSGESQALVQRIRQMTPGGDLKVSVTGTSAIIKDVVDGLYQDFPRAILMVVGIIYVALFLLFRSVVLPLKAVFMNALSIMASYGALVYIFQEGHFAGVLNFTPQGLVEATLPILMFCTVFGLSMDYEVFLLSRIKEAYDESGDNTASVALGLQRSGRIITGAALVMVLVLGSFALADIVLIKSMGVALALAVFIDATLVRALVVPATMRLLGDLNWWAPAFIKGVLPHKGSLE
ncbi:MAG: MMPL family transporter [Chloroflexi bacterium]|nr:MMPL family transporter [Chloroflexota bacterium]